MTLTLTYADLHNAAHFGTLASYMAIKARQAERQDPGAGHQLEIIHRPFRGHEALVAEATKWFFEAVESLRSVNPC